MDIDGVGGVSILAKARVFRAGVHFPAFSFEKHAETEGFGKVCPSIPIFCLKYPDTNNYIDGKKNEILRCGSSPLHHLAFVRALGRRFKTHGTNGRGASSQRSRGSGSG